MQTAILPVRYEITNTGVTSGASTMKQICSTVISEGGYEGISRPYVARRAVKVAVGTSLTPVVSIRLNSSYLGAIIVPQGIGFFPEDNGYYNVALIKNGTLTGATWGSTLSSGQVDVDTGATAITFTEDDITQLDYTDSSNQARAALELPSGFAWSLQLGVDLAGTSDVYTLAASIDTGTGDVLGNISFWNLTA
jgi:hypothetical protein